MCDKPLQSALAALGGGLGVLGGLGFVETVVLAGLLAGAADLAVHVVRRDPAVEPLRSALSADAS